MQCPNCSSQISNTANICGHCGAHLQAAPDTGISCPSCRAQNRPGVRFCENCGAAMLAGYTAPAPQPAASSSGWKGCGIAGGVVTIGVVLFLLVGGAIAAFYFMGWGKPAAPVSPPVTQVVVVTATLSQQTQPQAPIQPAAALPTVTLRPPDTSVLPTVPVSTATLGPPMFTADKNSLCRRGPSQIYDVGTSMNLGDTVKIFGKSGPPWDDWWYVEVLGSKCWVWSGLGNTIGDLSGVQVVQAPPTPTATVANVKMTLNNYTIVIICYVYLFDVNNPGLGWSADILGSNVIIPGKSYIWTGLPTGTYSVSISDCNNSSLDIKSNVQFNGNVIVNFP